MNNQTRISGNLAYWAEIVAPFEVRKRRYLAFQTYEQIPTTPHV